MFVVIALFADGVEAGDEVGFGERLLLVRLAVRLRGLVRGGHYSSISMPS